MATITNKAINQLAQALALAVIKPSVAVQVLARLIANMKA